MLSKSITIKIDSNFTSSVGGYETWQSRLRVFENQVLSGTLGGWRILHDELYNLCLSSNIAVIISRKMSRACSMYEMD
jgi:hypothetical protein